MLMEARIVVAIVVFIFVTFFNNFCLDLIILVHYWRAGDKLRSEVARNLTDSYRRTKSSLRKLYEEIDSEEAEERRKASKRHTHYCELAD